MSTIENLDSHTPMMHQGVLSGELPRHAVSLDRMMALAFGGQS
ncbi:hypothetical protein [Enterobacter kobei]